MAIHYIRRCCKKKKYLETTPFFFDFLKVYFIDYTVNSCPNFSPFAPIHPVLPFPPAIPPEFMSMGHTYKFFGFYISYTILTLPLSISHLSFMLLILCTFPPSPTPLLITLHVSSISVVLFLF